MMGHQVGNLHQTNQGDKKLLCTIFTDFFVHLVLFFKFKKKRIQSSRASITTLSELLTDSLTSVSQSTNGN